MLEEEVDSVHHILLSDRDIAFLANHACNLRTFLCDTREWISFPASKALDLEFGDRSVFQTLLSLSMENGIVNWTAFVSSVHIISLLV